MKINLGAFATLLTIVFITLKLTHVIAWSWIWVLSPMWIVFILWLVLFTVIMLAALAVGDRID